MKFFRKHLVIFTGAFIGLAGVILALAGNPSNMGFCMACFLRDTAGSLKLHSAEALQYARPEIIGLVLGSFLLSLVRREFKPRGGSSPILRLLMGAILMISALVFLGCPLRMVLRMSAGDISAYFGFIGFVLGVIIGTFFLRRGFSLNRSYKQSVANGIAMPSMQIVMLILLLALPNLLAFSEKGPGAAHANIFLSLSMALVVGMLTQQSSICQAGGIRDIVLLRDFHLFWGGLAIYLIALLGNVITHQFKIVSFGPIAHGDTLWNILSMVVVGLAAVLLGGCPLRQLTLSGTGDTDAGITVIGMLLGAAFAHNLGLASAPNKVVEGVIEGGPTTAGKIAVIIGLLLLIGIGFIHIRRPQKTK